MKMYAEFAAWWPLLSAPEEYAEEVAGFLDIFAQAGHAATGSLLELGSGGGNNALFLKHHFAPVTLTDLSPDMLAISRALNPDCEHITGDMRTLRLGRTFDVVFVHDAIDYMTTLDDLAAALHTAALHCKPGGMAMFIPDAVRETFEPDADHGGHDGAGRSMRYFAWTYDPDPADTTCVTDYVLLLRDGAAPAQVSHERHLCGLFSRAEWLRLLRDAGFAPRIFTDPFDREVFIGVLLNAQSQ